RSRPSRRWAAGSWLDQPEQGRGRRGERGPLRLGQPREPAGQPVVAPAPQRLQLALARGGDAESRAAALLRVGGAGGPGRPPRRVGGALRVGGGVPPAGPGPPPPPRGFSQMRPSNVASGTAPPPFSPPCRNRRDTFRIAGRSAWASAAMSVSAGAWDMDSADS